MRLDEGTLSAVEQLFARPDLPSGAVSPWLLSRYVAGDLSSAEREAVVEAIREDPALAASLAELEADEVAFESARPWEQVLDAIFERAAALPAEAAPAKKRPWRLWIPLLATAALLVVALLPSAPERPANRLKGSGLFAWQLLEGVPQPLEPGAVLREGDRIQFRITTGHDQLVLLGVDGTGTVSRYQPVGGELSAAIEPGQGVPLPDSLLLDAAPGPEVFVALLSDEPLLVEDLEQALHDAGDARALLGADLGHLAPQVHVFWVEKDLP